jgi:hypothetical protein
MIPVVGDGDTRAVVNFDFFEFASLKEGTLTICLGHALGNQDDFAFGPDEGGPDAMKDFANEINKLMAEDEGIRNTIAVLLDHDDSVRAILNLKKLCYAHFHIDTIEDASGMPVSKECLDIWYSNFGFRLTENDAVNMYENICELSGIELKGELA